MSAEASELVSIPRAELDALKAELKRLRREVGRGAAMARIQADSVPGDDAPAFTREELAEARLGHADPAITLRVYAHVIRSAETAAADIFPRAVQTAC